MMLKKDIFLFLKDKANIIRNIKVLHIMVRLVLCYQQK